jgi:NADH dehydrogenase FAD-containing subunit
MSRYRVVVIGSGFGGLTAAKALKNASVDVTMIARTQHHPYQGLLYQTRRPGLRMDLRAHDCSRFDQGEGNSVIAAPHSAPGLSRSPCRSSMRS